MAVQRIWFPHAPDGTIDSTDRARQAIGYGGISIRGLLDIGRAFESIITKVKSLESIIVRALTFESKVEN